MPRPKKSIAELKATGTYRPSRHGSAEELPVVVVESPAYPAFLNPEAVEFFNDIVGFGLDMDILGRADGFIIGMLSNEISEWMQLNEDVKEEGFYVQMPTATGMLQKVVNPKIKVRDEKLKVILKMLGEVGMSPAARSKVQVNEKNKQEKSALGEFLANIKK
ncbi:phage terminase small subunit P27 family [Vibrio parahaemolyticus]|uniref:phage terminase small subunit P27 family n=1 Tax=Vibrio parahaemolyticus TaxID=670 RepID=UPI001EC5B596|nr:phage terminase small subunit P27 family [Vibrio parahaemolyticus]ELK3867032.1 phage terminase small subunit P27 family [Vibrio parahaemolyticus]ELZ1477465.1 phage terminase small subunit P27 family [Vibrio parahaemolyticus]